MTDTFRDMPGFLIRRAHQTSTAVFAEEMASAGLHLTPFQFSALSAIAAEPGLDQASVAQRAECDRATMGGVIDRLVDRGCIARQVSTRDRRARVLELTDAGHALLGAAMPVAARVQQVLMAGLTEAERATLAALLARVADRDGAVSGSGSPENH